MCVMVVVCVWGGGEGGGPGSGCSRGWWGMVEGVAGGGGKGRGKGVNKHAEINRDAGTDSVLIIGMARSPRCM